MADAQAGPSLRWRVLALALTAIGLAWIVAAAVAYLQVRHEADELLDGYLAQTAAILLARVGDDLDEGEIEHAQDLHRYARRLAFQVWDRGTTLRLHSANAPDARLSPRTEGFDDVERDGRRWRVFSSVDRKGRVLVQVAEERHVRDEILAGVGRALAIPLAIALPALGILLGLAVTAGMRPLRTLGREVASRDPANLDPVTIQRPAAEIAPLVSGLNALLARVRSSLDHERRFTADAAHELRTPIAALRVQAQVASNAESPAVRARALDQVIAGCDRAARLVDQMLTLARLEPASGIDPGTRCDLAQVAREAVAEAAPAAVAKDIEFELDAAPATLRGDPALLTILLRNLLDNAVRYSPRGGRVRTAIERGRDGHAELLVEDTGPGVPPESLDRMGDRFFRGLGTDAEGSGLGLSIVARIAELHGATVTFVNRRDGHGLVVRVRFQVA